jgi:hypothetical protein
MLSKIAGWTALVLIAILVIAGQFFNLGKLFHRLMWLGVAGVALVGAINEWRR